MSTEKRPLYGLVIGVKRYELTTLDEAGDLLEVVEATEHALGGSVVDPPRMAGHDSEGNRRWTREVAGVAVRQMIARSRGASLVVPLWAWERAGEAPFPSISRVQAATPETLAGLRRRIDVRPFGLFLEGHTRRERDAAPVALDPGTDLAEYESLDWRGASGDVVGVDPNLFDNLGGKAHRWLLPRPVDDRTEVVIVPELIRRVGKAGGIIEAGGIGPDADSAGLRARYDDGRVADYLATRAAEAGSRALARTAGISRDAAHRLKTRRPVREVTIRRALRGLRADGTSSLICPVDGARVVRAGSTYCSVKCRATARKRRQRERAGSTASRRAVP